MWWIWVIPCLAAVPDRVAATVGEASVSQLAVDETGEWVVGVSGDTAWLLSIDAWSTHVAAPCAVRSVRVVEDTLWCGCADGEVARVALTDAGPGEVLEPLSVDAGEVLGLWSYNGEVWALLESDDGVGALSMWSIDPSTSAVTEETGVVFARRGFVEAVQHDNNVLIVHDSYVTKVNLAAGTALTGVEVSASTPVDVVPSLALGLYGVDSMGALWEYDATNLRWLVRMARFDSATALAVDLDEGWIGLAGEGLVEFWPIGDTFDAASPESSFAVTGAPSDTVTAAGGYTFAASSGVQVWTSNPWVSGLSVSPTSVTDGDTVHVDFAVDRAADWSLYRGGDRSGSGDRLASGTTEGGDVSASIVIDDAFSEGANRLYVLAEDGLAVGHARASVTVDNPPAAPTLTDANLGFGDGSLVLSFDGLSDADLDHYEVYVTTTPFDPADWPTGGPPFDGPDALVTPILLSSAGGEHVSYTIAPLTNGTTYDVAVRAFDQGGLMSPLSAVISNHPRETSSASQLAGDGGGPLCATSPVGTASLALAGALAAVFRRRRAAALALMLPGAAFAQDTTAIHGARRDLTLARGDFEVRYGPMQVADTGIQQVYGETGNQMLQFELGLQPFNAYVSGQRARRLAVGERYERLPGVLGFVELDLGFGMFQELATTVATDTNDAGETVSSSEVTMLTMWPLAADATFRLQLLDEQIIVPYARAGVDYVIWDERWDDGGGGKEKVKGAKQGSHYGAGVALLLDPVAPARASLLEAQSGINDTYLVVEWRDQTVEKAVGGGEGGMDFSGTMTTVGLKLDF